MARCRALSFSMRWDDWERTSDENSTRLTESRSLARRMAISASPSTPSASVLSGADDHQNSRSAINRIRDELSK